MTVPLAIAQKNLQGFKGFRITAEQITTIFLQLDIIGQQFEKYLETMEKEVQALKEEYEDREETLLPKEFTARDGSLQVFGKRRTNHGGTGEQGEKKVKKKEED